MDDTVWTVMDDTAFTVINRPDITALADWALIF